MEREKEEKRKDRDQYVKDRLKKTQFGGREMEIHKYNALKEKTEAAEKEKMDKQERLEFREQAALQKEKFEKLKAKNIQEL